MQRYEKSSVHDGVCVARFVIVTPDVDGESRLSLFYRDMSEKCENWFDEKCVAESIEIYESSDDPRKKWRWTPSVFCINFSFSDKDNKRTCTADISLSDNKGTSKLQRIYVWDTVLDRLCKKRVKKLSIVNKD